MEEKKKLEKITPEMLEDWLQAWKEQPTRDTIAYLADKWDRPPRSITAKLVKEGVYTKPPYTSKSGEPPVTKEELVRLIERAGFFQDMELEGLEKAPKLVLKKLLEIIRDI